MRRADGKIDENDAVAVRFNDPSEIGKGKKYRGGVIVRVNADQSRLFEKISIEKNGDFSFLIV